MRLDIKQYNKNEKKKLKSLEKGITLGCFFFFFFLMWNMFVILGVEEEY
jgi:hypothetical protein